MKKILLMMLAGILVGACATTGNTDAVQDTQTQATAATQIEDKDMWQSTTEPGEVTQSSCTRCDIVTQQKELEEIYQEVVSQAAQTGKMAQEFLTPSVLQ